MDAQQNALPGRTLLLLLFQTRLTPPRSLLQDYRALIKMQRMHDKKNLHFALSELTRKTAWHHQERRTLTQLLMHARCEQQNAARNTRPEMAKNQLKKTSLTAFRSPGGR